jgi:hypothetical protein
MITLNQTPDKYTPVSNPIIFQMSSDNSSIQFFVVSVQDNLGNVIINQRCYVSPRNLTSSYTNLSNILFNTVNYQMIDTLDVVTSTPDLIKAYQLVITEKLYSGGQIVDGLTLTTGVYYAFNGLIDKVNFTSYDYNNYVITSTSTQTHFLTNKPLVGTLYHNSTEYLYFLNDGLLGNAVFNLYTSNNVLIQTNSLPISSGSTANRIEVSPGTLNEVFSDFDAVFADEFNDIEPVSTIYYLNVAIYDLSGHIKSVTRTYILKDYPCSYVPVQILFGNALGGFDGIIAFNPREQIDITKTSIQKNPFQQDNSTGLFTDISNGIYNNDTETINVNSISTYKVITDPLSDIESFWLKELIKSPQVYILLPTGSYLPITITNVSYPVQQQRFNQSLVRLEITFTIPDTGIKFY